MVTIGEIWSSPMKKWGMTMPDDTTDQQLDDLEALLNEKFNKLTDNGSLYSNMFYIAVERLDRIKETDNNLIAYNLAQYFIQDREELNILLASIDVDE